MRAERVRHLDRTTAEHRVCVRNHGQRRGAAGESPERQAASRQRLIATRDAIELHGSELPEEEADAVVGFRSTGCAASW
jgi:hypothetical protein